MKADIKDILKTRELQALLVTGPAQHNPPMVYLTGGGHLTHADLIVPTDGEPTLFYRAMERDEAKATGLNGKDYKDFNYLEILKNTNGDHLKAKAIQYKLMLEYAGIKSGKIAIEGQEDAGKAVAIFQSLKEIMPEVEFVGDAGDSSVTLTAMATKDVEEIQRIREMGIITTKVVGRTAEYITSHSTVGNVVMNKHGEPLKVRDVKRKINLWLAEEGAENPHGTIFAIGRDASIPHSSGNPDDVLELGKTIVFDIFPCEAGGGYHYDFTRTWCLGYATDEATALYEDVMSVYNKVLMDMHIGKACKELQVFTCELFEKQGHPSIGTDPDTTDGYVHSLGHGLGLHVHERPWFGITADDDNILERGSVFTVEPGLYYPDKNMGCRIEDTYFMNEDGVPELFVDFDKQLVLPMKNN